MDQTETAIYSKETLAFLKNAQPIIDGLTNIFKLHTGIGSPNPKGLDLSEAAREYIKKLYGASNVNENAIDIHWTPLDNSVHYKCGNLYSFVLTAGICIPYSEWIYEDRFEWNLGNNTVAIFTKEGNDYRVDYFVLVQPPNSAQNINVNFTITQDGCGETLK